MDPFVRFLVDRAGGEGQEGFDNHCKGCWKSALDTREGFVKFFQVNIGEVVRQADGYAAVLGAAKN